jgi:hypothetical protein
VAGWLSHASLGTLSSVRDDGRVRLCSTSGTLATNSPEVSLLRLMMYQVMA